MLKAILRLTKQSFIYGIGQVLSKAIVIILLPLHTNFINPGEYGVFNVLLVFIGFMAIGLFLWLEHRLFAILFIRTGS